MVYHVLYIRILSRISRKIAILNLVSILIFKLRGYMVQVSFPGGVLPAERNVKGRVAFGIAKVDVHTGRTGVVV